MLFRKPQKSHGQVVRDELAESLGHFRTAAVSAAQGTAQRIAPRVDGAMIAVGLRKRPRRRRWPWIAGAVGIGAAAVGTVGFLLLRRRDERWADYVDPAHPEAEGREQPHDQHAHVDIAAPGRNRREPAPENPYARADAKLRAAEPENAPAL